MHSIEYEIVEPVEGAVLDEVSILDGGVLTFLSEEDPVENWWKLGEWEQADGTVATFRWD